MERNLAGPVVELSPMTIHNEKLELRLQRLERAVHKLWGKTFWGTPDHNRCHITVGVPSLVDLTDDEQEEQDFESALEGFPE